MRFTSHRLSACRMPIGIHNRSRRKERVATFFIANLDFSAAPLCAIAGISFCVFTSSMQFHSAKANHRYALFGSLRLSVFLLHVALTCGGIDVARNACTASSPLDYLSRRRAPERSDIWSGSAYTSRPFLLSYPYISSVETTPCFSLLHGAINRSVLLASSFHQVAVRFRACLPRRIYRRQKFCALSKKLACLKFARNTVRWLQAYALFHAFTADFSAGNFDLHPLMLCSEFVSTRYA